MSNRVKAKLKSLDARRKAYESMSSDKQKSRKRPGSRKK